MKKISRLSVNQFLCLLLALWTVLNIVQAAFTDLSCDETYYWVCSKVLDWGYFDHPPFFSWLVKPSVLLFGDNQLGVRFFSVLCQPIYLYLFWTLLRQFNYTKKGALLYFSIAFSIPLLQLYGWIITPDAPLMLSTALFLWLYKKFLDYEDSFNHKTLIYSILLGVSCAILGYAKYHGFLIIVLVLLSNLKLLTKPKTYIVIATAVLLYLPHINWQIEHNWVSLQYHLFGRTESFNYDLIWKFAFNFITTFNPFLIPLFLIFTWKNKCRKTDPNYKFEQALKFLTWGYIVFFSFSTKNNFVQPQWMITLCFPMLYFIFKAASSRTQLTKYLKRASLVFFFLFITLRVLAMFYDGELVKLDIIRSEYEYNKLAKKIDYRPFITNGDYRMASKYEFYTKADGYAKPDATFRSSQYQYSDFENSLYHKPIAIELSDSARKTLSKDALSKYISATIWINNPIIDTISDFVPVKDIKVECQMPAKTMSGQSIPLEISITNPYSWSVPLTGDGKYDLILYLINKVTRLQIIIPISEKEIGPYTKIVVNRNLEIPSEVATGEYNSGFSLVRFPYIGSYNSEVRKIHIVKP